MTLLVFTMKCLPLLNKYEAMGKPAKGSQIPSPRLQHCHQISNGSSSVLSAILRIMLLPPSTLHNLQWSPVVFWKALS